MLHINPTEAVPIWKQIEHEIRRLIATGTLAEGGVVPSVRELAQDLRVNPATVTKAYQRLTDQGILVVRRGEGTYVSGVPPVVRKPERREALAAAAIRYASLAATIGASEDEATDEIRKAFHRIGDLTRRR